MRRAIDLATLVIGLTAVPAVLVPVASMDVRGVRVEVHLDKAVYAPGDPVEATLALTNAGQATASFQFPTAQMYDFVVTHEGQRVWQWSFGKAFLQALTTLMLTPGETKRFVSLWDQRDTQGRQVPFGVYDMAAIFPVGGGGVAPPGSQSPRVQFSIAVSSMSSGPQRTPAATSRPTIIEGTAGGEVLVNSQVVFRIHAAAGGLSASRRAEVVAGRLQRLFAQHLKPEGLAIMPVRQDAAIMWRRDLVVTIDANDARAAHTEPLTLAAEWLRALTRALSAPH